MSKDCTWLKICVYTLPDSIPGQHESCKCCPQASLSDVELWKRNSPTWRAFWAKQSRTADSAGARGSSSITASHVLVPVFTEKEMNSERRSSLSKVTDLITDRKVMPVFDDVTWWRSVCPCCLEPSAGQQPCWLPSRPYSTWTRKIKPHGQKNAQRGVAAIWIPPPPINYYPRHPFWNKTTVKDT